MLGLQRSLLDLILRTVRPMPATRTLRSARRPGPPQAAGPHPLRLAAGLLAVAGLGCGQFTAVTTITRDAAGRHAGEWSIDLTLDPAVFARIEAMSAEPIDLEYRATLFGDAGWQARAGSSGISARRAITVPDEINRKDNALVRLFAGDEGDPPEENIVRWTELEIDDSQAGQVDYRYAAEVYVPAVNADEMLDQIVLSLSPGRAVAIDDEEQRALKEAMVAAGPFVVQIEAQLPGTVDPASLRGGGEVVGDGQVRWRLDQGGSYLLEARSRLDLSAPARGEAPEGEAPGGRDDGEADGPEGADEAGAKAKGGDQLAPHQVGALLLGGFGGVVAAVGLKSAIWGTASLLSPPVIFGGLAVGVAVWVWNHGPPPPPPNPVQRFIDAARNNVAALELSSLRGLSVEEARELGFELERLSPAQRQAVSEQLGVPYTTLIEALKDARKHPELFE